ncbi:MAG: prolipoprotein diacylglyceryl transferase [Acidobacteriota bacterium]
MYPVLITFGTVSISTYYAVASVAFLCAFVVGYRRAYREGLDARRLFALAPLLLTSCFIGARLLHVLVNIRTFMAHPWLVLALWQGGLVGYGALLAIPTGIWYLRRLHAPVWHVADVAAPSIALAICIYRIGCFAAGCCYGAPTSMPWGVLFPRFVTDPFADWRMFRGFGPTDVAGVFRHPTQLYESLFGVVMFIVLSAVLRRTSRRDGAIFFGFLIAYAIWRFGIETLRDDPRGQLLIIIDQGTRYRALWIDMSLSEYLSHSPTASSCFWLSASQIVSVFVALGSGMLLSGRLSPRVSPASRDS